MNRGTFLKSLLAIVVAPKVIKELVKEEAVFEPQKVKYDSNGHPKFVIDDNGNVYQTNHFPWKKARNIVIPKIEEYIAGEQLKINQLVYMKDNKLFRL